MTACKHVPEREAPFTTPVETPPPNAPACLTTSASTCSSDFTFVRPINRGAHSLVHVVLRRGEERYYALKVLSKQRLACAGASAARAVLRE